MALLISWCRKCGRGMAYDSGSITHKTGKCPECLHVYRANVIQATEDNVSTNPT